MALRLQSAMEYLMTYGWAILIVAIVMVAMYSFGVFSGSNFAPRAQPGSCQVVKTVQGANLAGQCNNEQPQFVAQFNGDSGSSYITLSPIQAMSSYSISFWIMPTDVSYQHGILLMGGNDLTTYSYGLDLRSGGDHPCSIGTAGKMESYIVTFDGTNLIMYLNGNRVCSWSSGTGDLFAISPVPYIGKGGYGNLQGNLSNLQVYNVSLSVSEVQYLYGEGIGGSPTMPQNLVGWWPLNGNAQDYSGNGNNGAPTGKISYIRI